MVFLIILAFLWSIPWKGLALWKAARNYQKNWFVAIFLLQTLGVLEIIYLAKFQKDQNPPVLFHSP